MGAEWSHRAMGLSGDYRVDPEQHRMSYPDCDLCATAAESAAPPVDQHLTEGTSDGRD